MVISTLHTHVCRVHVLRHDVIHLWVATTFNWGSGGGGGMGGSRWSYLHFSLFLARLRNNYDVPFSASPSKRLVCGDTIVERTCVTAAMTSFHRCVTWNDVSSTTSKFKPLTRLAESWRKFRNIYKNHKDHKKSLNFLLSKSNTTWYCSMLFPCQMR